MNKKTDTATRVGKRVVRSLNWIVDCIVLVILVLLLIFAAYSLWDNEAMYEEASSRQYETYKPKANNTVSFEELQAMNPDVLGWLTIYGTNIDYPMVKSQWNNEEYLSKNAMGEITGSGSIFLDYRNNVDFSDFNTVIYGHHMEKSSMFGDIDKFLAQEFFESHPYGDIYYSGAHHGLELVAMLQVDAYDTYIYIPGINGWQNQWNYIGYIGSKAKFARNLETVTPADHLVMMSTCSSDITNGRFILVGRILDNTVENPYYEEDEIRKGEGIDVVSLWNRIKALPTWVWMLILFIILILIYLLYTWMERRRYKKRQQELAKAKAEAENQEGSEGGLLDEKIE